MNGVQALQSVLGVWIKCFIGSCAISKESLALIGWRPRRASLAWLGVAVSAVAGLLAETLNLPQWLRNVSPFEHVPSYPAAPFEWLPLVALTVLAIVVAAAGLAGVARRDIG